MHNSHDKHYGRNGPQGSITPKIQPGTPQGGVIIHQASRTGQKNESNKTPLPYPLPQEVINSVASPLHAAILEALASETETGAHSSRLITDPTIDPDDSTYTPL